MSRARAITVLLACAALTGSCERKVVTGGSGGGDQTTDDDGQTGDGSSTPDGGSQTGDGGTTTGGGDAGTTTGSGSQSNSTSASDVPGTTSEPLEPSDETCNAQLTEEDCTAVPLEDGGRCRWKSVVRVSLANACEVIERQNLCLYVQGNTCLPCGPLSCSDGSMRDTVINVRPDGSNTVQYTDIACCHITGWTACGDNYSATPCDCVCDFEF